VVVMYSAAHRIRKTDVYSCNNNPLIKYTKNNY
jgi:hypothetical protein